LAQDLASLPQVLLARLDIEDSLSIGQAVSLAAQRFGQIDALVNIASYGQYGLFEVVPTIPRDKIQQQVNANVLGVMDVTRAVLPHMTARGGVIVNVTSGAGVFTLPMISLYCASKFALEGFSKALSYDLASQNIAVKIVDSHGDMTSTRFNQRIAESAASNASLSNYDGFVERTYAAFARMAAASNMTADEVAALIFQAATDGTGRLRYPVGDDSPTFYGAWKQMADQDYLAFMRAQFAS
jgi:NAD(P)-dependent dehydrogenase (short-subunit alcohol dehydrogenase family)